VLYLVAIILPPLAILLCGKPFQAIFSVILLVLGVLVFVGTLGLANGITFVIWIGCIAHAMFTVHGRNQAARDRALAESLSREK
tara:strand:- start:4489 stop:4740 length:252 start_codon:yes stop_codon:yes gene_type:complete